MTMDVGHVLEELIEVALHYRAHYQALHLMKRLIQLYPSHFGCLSRCYERSSSNGMRRTDLVVQIILDVQSSETVREPGIIRFAHSLRHPIHVVRVTECVFQHFIFRPAKSGKRAVMNESKRSLLAHYLQVGVHACLSHQLDTDEFVMSLDLLLRGTLFVTLSECQVALLLSITVLTCPAHLYHHYVAYLQHMDIAKPKHQTYCRHIFTGERLCDLIDQLHQYETILQQYAPLQGGPFTPTSTASQSEMMGPMSIRSGAPLSSRLGVITSPHSGIPFSEVDHDDQSPTTMTVKRARTERRLVFNHHMDAFW